MATAANIMAGGAAGLVTDVYSNQAIDGHCLQGNALLGPELLHIDPVLDILCPGTIIRLE